MLWTQILDVGKKYFVVLENRRIGYILDNKYFDRYNTPAGYVTVDGELYSTVVESLTDEEKGVVAWVRSNSLLERVGGGFSLQLIAEDDPQIESTKEARGNPDRPKV